MAKEFSLGKSAVFLTISKMMTLVIAMITSMLLSRFRTIEEYGTYSQLQLIISLSASVFMLGLPSSINYFLAKANSAREQQEFLGVYYTLTAILSVLLGIVLAAATPLIAAYFKNPAVLSFAYFLFLYPWACITTSGIENIFIVYHRTQILTAYRIVDSLCMLGVVLAAQWLDLGFRGFMVLHLAAYCCFALYVYYAAHKISGGIRIGLKKNLLRAIFVFSLPMGLSSVVGTLNIELDKLLIGFLMDTEQMAIYTNSSKELPVSFVAASITAVLLPQMTRMLKEERNRDAIALWANATELSYILICLIVAGVFTYAEDVMTLLYSEKYLPGLNVFRVYTLVLLLRCTYFGMILNAKGRTKDIFYASVAALVLNMILNPLLYWLMGMIGPAIATFLSMFVVLLWQLYRTARCTDVTFMQVFPWKRIGRITVMNVILAVLFYGIKQFLPLDQWFTSLGESLALGGCWTIVYLLIMRNSIKRAWSGLNQGGEENANH